MQATATAPAKARDVDLILIQIDTLPALPAIATRLLALTDQRRIRNARRD